MIRKVTYEIDDLMYFRNKWKDNVSQEDFDKLFSDSASFIATYILYGGNGQFPDHYQLLDKDRNDIPLLSLNGFQKGIILNDCQRHFRNTPCEDGTSNPCGVINIIEENVEEISK